MASFHVLTGGTWRQRSGSGWLKALSTFWRDASAIYVNEDNTIDIPSGEFIVPNWRNIPVIPPVAAPNAPSISQNGVSTGSVPVTVTSTIPSFALPPGATGVTHYFYRDSGSGYVLMESISGTSGSQTSQAWYWMGDNAKVIAAFYNDAGWGPNSADSNILSIV
jgi:hypothetical protein